MTIKNKKHRNMKEICFKQEKPITVTIMGYLLLILAIINYSILSEFLMAVFLSMLLLGYRVVYKITKTDSNYTLLSVFGIVVFSKKKNIMFPEYISLVNSGFSKANEWGPVAALGTRSKSDKTAIRLFNKQGNFTIYKSSNISNTRELAVQLSEMLNIELVDNLT